VKILVKLIAAVCLVSAIAGREATTLSAADVEVRLNDGRTLRGSVIEGQTSRAQLALELRSSGITMRRTLSWNQIASVQVAPLPKKNELRATARPESPIADEHLKNATKEAVLPLSEFLVSARPVSTFGKIDWDSLRVGLRGIDVRGRPVPLFGTLKLTLWGQRRIPPESNIVRYPFVTDANYGSRFLAAPSNSYAYQHPAVMAPNSIVQLASWTQAITENDAGVLLLPLQRPLADHDVRIGDLGELAVELLMPGVGVFEATVPDVVLSHQSELRRARLDRDGSRFFPNETTTDSPQTARARNRFNWPGASYGPERGSLGP